MCADRRTHLAEHILKRLWIRPLVAAVAVSVAFEAAVPARAQLKLATFFPTRPTHAGMKWARGVLTAYDRNAAFGGFDLREDGTGQIDRFAIARHMWIGGRSVTCTDPPQPGYDHFEPSAACPDWPANVVIGSTHVVVAYWTTIDPEGRETNASDTIAVTAPRRARGAVASR
jgi:hypothetical protein